MAFLRNSVTLKRTRENLASAVVAVGVALIPALSAADEYTPALRDVLRQAKEEGSVRIFLGSGRYPQSAADALSAAFEEKFGFPLETEFASLGAHPPTVNKLAAEARLGIEPPADLFPTAERLLEVLRKAGAVEPTDWAALGVPESRISERGDAVYVWAHPRTVIYNTDLVAPEDVPHSYLDLLNPKFKGSIVAPSFGSAFAGLSMILGEQETYDFVRKLVEEQNLMLVQTYSDVTTKVANGEYAIAYGLNADSLGHVEKGAPIANAPLEKVWASTNFGAVLKNAANPAAAKALGYFICCTEEGMKAIYEQTNRGTFDVPDTELHEIGGGGKQVLPTFEFSTEKELPISQNLSKILTGN